MTEFNDKFELSPSMCARYKIDKGHVCSLCARYKMDKDVCMCVKVNV
jgi:hypothetical protein